jgi:hypothetical protein
MPVEFYSPIKGRIKPIRKQPSFPGDKYSRLTLVKEVDGQECKISWRKWHVLCDCGTEKTVALNAMRNGNTLSCGCAGSEATASRNRSNATHGLREHPLYHTWISMLKRCENPKAKQWANYGGRGIAICERWRAIENFIEDMYPTHRVGLSLERTNNNLGYSPENCLWATQTTQCRNKRTNRLISYQGRNITMVEAVEIAGLNYGTVRSRLTSYGWPISRALGHEFGEPINQ